MSMDLEVMWRIAEALKAIHWAGRSDALDALSKAPPSYWDAFMVELQEPVLAEIRRAIAEEREACAAIVEDTCGPDDILAAIADRIRGRP